MDAQSIAAAAKDLRTALGDDKVLTDDFVLSSYTRDNATLFWPLTPPSIVTLPHSTEDVRRILQVANERRIPVVPSGGRTSIWAGIDAVGGIVVDMCNMNSLLRIDEANMSFTAQAGALVYNIDRELRKRGYHYPVHPPHAGPMSMGAEVTKDTCGTSGVMHGHIHRRLIGMEVVLGNGDIIETGASRTMRGMPDFLQSGLPDLTQVFIGTEGAFGIVTEVTMALYPSPVARGYLKFEFGPKRDSLEAILASAHDMRKKRLAVTIYSGDPLAETFIARHAGWKGAATSERNWFMSCVVESLISQAECDIYRDEAARIVESHGGRYLGDNFQFNIDAPENDWSWEIYPKLAFGIKQPWLYLGGHCPYDRVGAFYDSWLDLMHRYGYGEKGYFALAYGPEAAIPQSYTHFDPQDADEMRRWHELNERIMEAWAELGIIPYRAGRIWRPYLLDKIDPRALDYLRRVKQVFDPNGIMNPGVSVF